MNLGGEWLDLQRGPLGPLKEFGFYPESDGKPSKSCKQGAVGNYLGDFCVETNRKEGEIRGRETSEGDSSGCGEKCMDWEAIWDIVLGWMKENLLVHPFGSVIPIGQLLTNFAVS